MVPPQSHPRYKQLVTGEFTHSFETFSGSMCVSRNMREVKNAGGSAAAIDAAVADVHSFFVKFEAVLAADLKAIFG